MQFGGKLGPARDPADVRAAPPALGRQQRGGGRRNDGIRHAGQADDEARLVGTRDRGRQRIGNQVVVHARQQFVDQRTVAEQSGLRQPIGEIAAARQHRLGAVRRAATHQQPRGVPTDIRLDRRDDSVQHPRQHQPRPLPHVLGHAMPAAWPLYAELGPLVDPRLSGLGRQAQAQGLVNGLRTLAAAVGLPDRLRAVGVRAEHVPLLAADAMKQTRLLINNPVPITQADAERLYAAAL